MTWLAIAAGGAFGSVARHGVAMLVNLVIGRSAPYATAAVNLIGSLIIGCLAGLLAGGHLRESQPMRAFVFVGILGGFTTFSSFVLDSLVLAEGGEPGAALANLGGQLLAGYALAYAGYRLTA